MKDIEHGKIVMVPCMPLSTLLLAANITTIDFLTICTGSDADNERVKDVINSRKFQVKVGCHVGKREIRNYTRADGQNYFLKVDFDMANISRWDTLAILLHFVAYFFTIILWKRTMNVILLSIH